MLKTALAVALLCAVSSCGMNPAFAKVRSAICVETGDVMRPTCGMGNAVPTASAKPPALALEARRSVRAERRELRTAALTVGVDRPRRTQPTAAQVETAMLGGRPNGCPSQYCGCGASLHLFGRIIPSLNLAANWLRFPRAAPAPGMAAARRGHVFVLEAHLGGDTWLVHDSNSGGHQTRLHARSIAGFAIVNPTGAV